MAECINEYRVEVGENLPVNDWREWKNLFIKGAILPVVLPRPPPPAEPPTEKEIRLAKVSTWIFLTNILKRSCFYNPESIISFHLWSALGGIVFWNEEQPIRLIEGQISAPLGI